MKQNIPRIFCCGAVIVLRAYQAIHSRTCDALAYPRQRHWPNRNHITANHRVSVFLGFGSRSVLANWPEVEDFPMPDGCHVARSQRKPNLRDVAYERLTEILSTAKLQPGQFVSQRELVEITGLPLAAIRDAIPRLEAERLLVTIPQRGMQIVTVDFRMVREVFELWLILAKTASERLSEIPSADAFDNLEHTHQDLIVHAPRSPDKAFFAKALKTEDLLHDLLVATLDNAIVSDIYRVNKLKLDIIRLSQGTPRIHDVICSAKERMKIIQMAKRGDNTQTIRAMEAHMEATMKRACALLARPPLAAAVISCDGKEIAA